MSLYRITKKLLLLSLVMMSGIAVAQSAKGQTTEKPAMKTIRLHIDGFMKSKSGAI